MVVEDVGNVLVGNVESGSDVLEGLVVGGEDGDILEFINGLGQFSLVESATERSQASGESSSGDVNWESEKVVDNVDDASGEVEVLREVS